MNEKEPVINELGCDPSLLPFRVDRPFYLAVKNGPLQVVAAGSMVRLADQTRLELFQCGKITPSFLQDGDVYRIVMPFRHTTEAGEWLDLHPGQRLRLSAQEAVQLLRANKVVIDNMED